MGKGYIGLREVLADRRPAREGHSFNRQNVLLANGSSNALSLCAAALLDPGDGVIVESLSYPFMLKYLAGRGADVRTVPLDDEGMDIDAVEAQLEAFRAEGVTPKLIYTIATFQVPTGIRPVLGPSAALVQLAAEWNVFVIEDNCYYDMYLDTPPPPDTAQPGHLRPGDPDRQLQQDPGARACASGYATAQASRHRCAWPRSGRTMG